MVPMVSALERFHCICIAEKGKIVHISADLDTKDKRSGYVILKESENGDSPYNCQGNSKILVPMTP